MISSNEIKLLKSLSQKKYRYQHKFFLVEGSRLIEELINQHKQILCYVTSDTHDPILRTPETRIKNFYINKLLALLTLF